MTPVSPPGMPSDPASATRRRLRSAVASSLAAVFVLLLAITAAGLWWRHGEVLRDAERRTGTLATVVAQHLALRFKTLEGALFQLAAHDRLVGGPNAPPQEWMPILRAVHSGLAGIASLSVTDAGGVVTYSTEPMSMGHSYAGGALYTQLSANPMSDAIAFGPLARDRATGTVLMPAGRALRTPDGNFEGMLIALVEPAALGDLYRQFEAAPPQRLRIFDADGQPLVPAPHFADPLDRPPPEIPIGQSPSGVVFAAIEDGGESYLTVYERVAGSGVTVAVSSAESTILRPWWHEVVAVLGAVVLAGLLMLAAGLRIVRNAIATGPADGQ